MADAITATTESTEVEFLDLQKLKVADLRRELKARNLTTTGNKNDLLERLQAALQSGIDVTEPEDDAAEDYVLEDDVLADEVKAADSTEGSFHDESILNSPTEVKPPDTKTPFIEKENKIQDVNTTVALPENDSTEAETKKEITSLATTKTSASLQEKLELRAKRFNMPLNEESKKKVRAERFGIKASANSKPGFEKLAKRSERFGMPLPKPLQQAADKEKLQKRAERFGIKPSALAQTDSKVVGLKRKERFGSASKKEEEEKKRKRAERFGLVS